MAGLELEEVEMDLISPLILVVLGLVEVVAVGELIMEVVLDHLKDFLYLLDELFL